MRASATAFPIPLPAPVTIATFSVEAMNEPSALLVGRLGYHEPRVTVFIERDLESQEIGVLFEHDDADASSGEERPSIIPAGPPPAMQHCTGAVLSSARKEAASMRIYTDINLADRTITWRELHGEAVVKAGRYLIARTLLERDAATVDPLGPQNPLIFSAGPFAGTSFSNANRTSVGCKSPLTGGVKEANGGGTFGYALAQRQIAGFTLGGAAADWVVLHFRTDGTIAFDDARRHRGKGNFEA